MIHRSRVYLSVHYALMLEYRAELVLWVLANSLPFIVMGAWMETSAGGGFPLGPEEFARYFLCVFITRQLTAVWVVWEFQAEVVEGKLSPRLLLPIDPVWRHVASHVAERGARLPFSAALILGVIWLLPEARWVPSLAAVLAFLLACAAAFVSRFIFQYTMALMSFWTERASAIQSLWYLFYTFLSGMIAPLAVFPPAARTLAELTPFPYLVHLPATLLMGRPVALGPAAVVLGVWTAVALVLNRVLWHRGLRHYSGMGA